VSEGTRTGQPPPNGGSNGREEQLATVPTAVATQPEASSPRVAPSGAPLPPRVAPDQTSPTRPQQLADQPNGFHPAPVEPVGSQASGAMPPPEIPIPPDQQPAYSPPSRRPTVPVWDPPAEPGPRRSLREWLGFGSKPKTPQHQMPAPATGQAIAAPQPVARHAAAPDVPAAVPDGTVTPPVDSPVAHAGAPIQPVEPVKQEEPVERTGPAPLPGPIQRAEPVEQPTVPAPGAVPAPAPPETKPGTLPAMGAAAAAVASTAVAAARSGAEKLAAQTKPKPGTARRTRKARLRLSRMDPWSVMKTSFLFSIAAGIMLVVAVYTVWAVLESSGLFDSINDIVASVISTPGDTTPFRVQDYVNTQKVMGVAALIACVDVVIFTALATLGSFLYNLAATMLGGLEITLAED
jgi:Transmembrane domain of unknown function (DUF3566)